MTGVPGCFDRAYFQRADANDVIVVQYAKALFWHWCKAAPEFFHLVSENARGGFDETRRIEKMRRATRMDVDDCAKFGKAPCRTGVIEMNVAQKRVAHIGGRETNFTEFGGNILERRFGTDIEKHKPVVGLDSGHSNDAWPVEHACIENVD